MIYLILEILAFLILALLLGLFVGKWFANRKCHSQLAVKEQRWEQKLRDLSAENLALRAKQNSAPKAVAKTEGSSALRIEALQAELDEANLALQVRGQKLEKLEAELAECRGQETKAPEPRMQPIGLADLTPDTNSADDGGRPEALAAPENGKGDDLKQIKGIGPTIEKKLHDLGIYHFRQIAEFTPENIEWVNGFLSFKGRIDREKWVKQAKKLAKQ